MDIAQIRIANAKRALESAGGVAAVAKLLGYANASFLVQMFGPAPTRNPTEKTMRKLEHALNLEPGSLDRPLNSSAPAPAVEVSTAPKTGVDTVVLADAIKLMARLVESEKLQLSVERNATLIAMAYEDAIEHGGQARESKMRQVLQLLR